MSYQLKHKEFGIYQGTFLGLGFWHPMSDMPEQGYCEFPTLADVEEYIDFLCSDKCSDPLKHKDLSIEKYNNDESDKLITAGLICLGREN